IEKRFGVDEDAHAVEVIDAIALAGAGIELDGVGKTRTTAAGDAETKATLFGRDTFLGHGDANTLDGTVGELQPLARRACGHLRWGQLRFRRHRRCCQSTGRRGTLRWLGFDCHHVRHDFPFPLQISEVEASSILARLDGTAEAVPPLAACYCAVAVAAGAVSVTPFFFFQSPIAAR